MGSLYKQSGSRVWWVKYCVHGRPVRESTGTADEQGAKRCLKTREGQVAAGQPLLVNAGVSERVAMTITGHKTRSVFDRYHIVSPGDLQEAARRMAGFRFGHSRADGVDKGGVSS